ncbi:MAG TPA: hypothetical protein DD670_06760, partial [Planctomycetaceae bacterium]|nr:hypothetical protein [Planctomycetaceae bacterium]
MPKRHTIRIGHCGLGLLLAVLAAMAQAAFAQPATSEAAPRDREPHALVGLLGSDSFAQRQWAEHALRKMDAAARDALLDGLRSGDLQTRRASRRLLDAVGGIDAAREAAFLARGSEVDASDLPGWSRSQQAVGG